MPESWPLEGRPSSVQPIQYGHNVIGRVGHDKVSKWRARALDHKHSRVRQSDATQTIRERFAFEDVSSNLRR
jgi:hypothetical protein